MTITIDLPVKDEAEKRILTEYLKMHGELFLKYYLTPDKKINSKVEEEIVKRTDEDYVEVDDVQDILKLLN